MNNLLTQVAPCDDRRTRQARISSILAVAYVVAILLCLVAALACMFSGSMLGFYAALVPALCCVDPLRATLKNQS